MTFVKFFHNLIGNKGANMADIADIWFKAAEDGDIGTIRSMIVQGVDVNMRDAQERTALNIASQHFHTDVMTTILAARQMDYLKSIGMDPFQAATTSSTASYGDDMAQTGTIRRF